MGVFNMVCIIFLLPFLIGAQQKPVSFEQAILDKDIQDDYYLSIFQERDGYLWLDTYVTLYCYNSGYGLVASKELNGCRG